MMPKIRHISATPRVGARLYNANRTKGPQSPGLSNDCLQNSCLVDALTGPVPKLRVTRLFRQVAFFLWTGLPQWPASRILHIPFFGIEVLLWMATGVAWLKGRNSQGGR